MKIVSLFDGMACGMLAMLGADVKVDEYYAYEIDKYAVQTATHNFPNIIECGDVFKADFTQYKDIDFIVGGSPCVPAGSKIKTDKGYKNIEDVVIGDLVLTHKNRYRPVSRLYQRESNHIYHIKFNGNNTLDITGNHPVYVYRNNAFDFVRADELTTNDYVCINIDQHEEEVDYSDDILWLLGRTIADGYYCESKHNIVIAVGKNKIEEFEKHLSKIHFYCTHKDRPSVEYVIKNNHLTELYSYFCNKKALEKFIPDAILRLPTKQLRVVFDGYISGDGFKRKDKVNTIMWSSSSYNLTLSLAAVTAKLFGKYPTISVRDGEYKKLPSGYCHTAVNYNSQISITNRENPDVKIIEDKLLMRIKAILKEDTDIKVYNLETAEDHTYTVNNCIVHNCTYWSIAQKNNRETEASGLGWELFSQYVRALNEIKPRFFIYENNKSMSKAIRESITETFGFDAICINSALVSAQNRQRLYWVGKRNEDGTYSKVDVQQPEDRGILLRDILDGAMDMGNQPIGETRDGKSYCLTAGYSNGSGENIGNYAAHTLEKGCKSMVAEPVNTTPNEKSQTIKAQYQQTSIANICKYTSTYGAIGVAETVVGSPKQVGAMPRPNGELSTSQGFRIYDVNGKTVTLKGNAGGAGGKTGLYLTTAHVPKVVDDFNKYSAYAEPCEWDDNGTPTKAISSSDGKTYTVYSVSNGIIVIKGKEYPIKLKDGYYIIRKLSVNECKRLQTVPEWYEFPVSNAQAYKMLGNGWTVEVIIHLIKSCLTT